MTSFNQNIDTPFNEEFCSRLEYRIGYELAKLDDPDLKGFWCDGVSWFPNEIELTAKHVNDTRKIETKAWLGKTGQDVYMATIRFGNKALSKYARGISLIECIPDLESKTDWLEIDIDGKTIEVKLN